MVSALLFARWQVQEIAPIHDHPSTQARSKLMAQRLVYLVTEDWAFWRHRLPMARAARDAGFDVHLITNVQRRGDLIVEDGFSVHALDFKRGSTSPTTTLATIAAVRERLKQIKPDIIHNVALKPLVIGTAAAFGLGPIAVVSSINGLGSAFIAPTWQGKVLRFGLRRTLKQLHDRRNTCIIVQNPEDFASLKGIGIATHRLRLIPGSGVDCDLLQPLPEPPPEPVRVAFVGRMLDDKGLRSLIRAHRLGRARGSTVELLLAGEPDLQNPTSISKAEFASWTAEPGMFPLGHIEDIREVWKQAHIAVLPSRGEGLPKSLLEAAACGRPVIGTDVPGCREIVIDGETGIMVDVDDDVALANAIEELAGDKAKRERMGRAARRLTEVRFSATDIGRQTVAVYRELLDRVAANQRQARS